MAPTAGARPRRGRGRPGRPARRRRSAPRPCDAPAETPGRRRAPRRAPGARRAGAERAGAPRGPPTGWPRGRARARPRCPSTSPPPSPGAPARARGRGGRGSGPARSLEVARARRARQRPTPGEAVLDPMPEGDLGLPELPAEVDDLAVQLRGEVDQAELHVLQVRAARLDLRDDPVELLHQGAGRGPLPHELLRREARELDTRLARQAGQLLVQPERTALQTLHQDVETRHARVRFLEAERLLRSHAKRDATGFAPECRVRAPPAHADPLVRPPPLG